MISNSLGEYLKTIYLIIKKKEKPRVTDIAEKMQCSKPSVNKSLKLLKQEDLIIYEPYGKIILTEKGKRQAKKIIEANDIVYLFLTEILKQDKETAKSQAREIKMKMNDDTLNKLAKYVYKELGLYNLDCGYDINNYRCVECLKKAQATS